MAKEQLRLHKALLAQIKKDVCKEIRISQEQAELKVREEFEAVIDSVLLRHGSKGLFLLDSAGPTLGSYGARRKFNWNFLLGAILVMAVSAVFWVGVAIALSGCCDKRFRIVGCATSAERSSPSKDGRGA
jgi:hypothetical protein